MYSELDSGVIGQEFAKEILETYCKFLNVKYVDTFLTLDSYSRECSKTFPGLKKFLFLRNNINDSSSEAQLKSFEGAVRTIAKNICYIQLKYLTDTYTGFINISTYSALYLPMYLFKLSVISEEVLYMVLSIFDEEYKDKTDSLFNHSSLKFDTIDCRLEGKKSIDKLFGGYSINYVLNNIDKVLSENYKKGTRNYQFDSEVFISMFKDNLIKIIELFYNNKQSKDRSYLDDWYDVSSKILDNIINSKYSTHTKIKHLIRVGLISKPN